MPPIDELVSADVANTPLAIEILTAFHADLVPTFELVGDLLQEAIDLAAERFGAQDAEDERRLVELSVAVGVTHEQLLETIKGSGHEPGTDDARAIWQGMRSRQAQRFVLLLLYRYFRWGVSDLIRMRVTPVAGYVRLQAEAVALLSLFDETPDLATEWLGASLTEHGGRQFYRKSQPDLNRIMARDQLANFYERGSSSFQHVRMASAVPGLRIEGEETRLQDQEIDPDDVGSYIRRSLWLMSAQLAILASVSRLLGGQSRAWEERRGSFNRRFGVLWHLMEERYPLPDDPE